MFPANFNLANLNGTNGFTLIGVNLAEGSGYSVSGAGDINNDGIDDVIIGAPGEFSPTVVGQSYVVFGSKTWFPAKFNLTSLDGKNGFAINGINRDDASGWSVSYAGDINGDGIDDIIIGAPYANTNAGQSYVVFGSKMGFPAQFNLTSLDGKNGFALNGINPGDESGNSVSEAGDINGDGIDDIIIGTPSVKVSYIVFGSKTGFPAQFNVDLLNGTNGFTLIDINTAEYYGNSVSGAGDVNDDGIDDVIIGASGANNAVSYVVFGSKMGFPAQFNLGLIDGINGFAINGINSGDYSGTSVSGAGDINGDGIDDVIIGAPDANVKGQSYIIFGSNARIPSPFFLSLLNGVNGFTLNGIWQEFSGTSVSGAGDINGDGIDDVIIGAPDANVKGQSYVIFGSKGDTPTPTPDNHEGLSAVVIAGITIGSIVAVGSAIGAAWWYFHKDSHVAGDLGLPLVDQ
jgi:flavodoxin